MTRLYWFGDTTTNNDCTTLTKQCGRPADAVTSRDVLDVLQRTLRSSPAVATLGDIRYLPNMKMESFPAVNANAASATASRSSWAQRVSSDKLYSETPSSFFACTVAFSLSLSLHLCEVNRIPPLKAILLFSATSFLLLSLLSWLSVGKHMFHKQHSWLACFKLFSMEEANGISNWIVSSSQIVFLSLSAAYSLSSSALSHLCKRTEFTSCASLKRYIMSCQSFFFFFFVRVVQHVSIKKTLEQHHAICARSTRT